MARADEVRARYEAELALAEAEDRLVELKDADDPEALRDHKHQLREMRRAYRLEREGSAAAQANAVAAAAVVESAGVEL